MKQHLKFCQTPGQILPPLTPWWTPISSVRNTFWDFHMGQSCSSLSINPAAAGNVCKWNTFLKWINCLGKCRHSSWASLKCLYVRDSRWNIYYLHLCEEGSIWIRSYALCWHPIPPSALKISADHPCEVGCEVLSSLCGEEADEYRDCPVKNISSCPVNGFIPRGASPSTHVESWE